MLFISTNLKYQDSVKAYFDKVTVLDSLLDVDISNEDTVVFHSCKDILESQTLTLTLSHIVGGLEKKIYINNEPNSVLVTIFEGVNGDIYDNEDALEDMDILKYLIDEYGHTGITSSKDSSVVDKVKDAFDYLSSAKPSEVVSCLRNEDWHASLDAAISDCKDLVVRSNDITKPFQETLDKAWLLVNQLKESLETLNTRHSQLLAEYNSSINSSREAGETYVFPSYEVSPVSRVLYVKVCSPCIYLVSFLLSFQEWYRTVMQKNTRLLIVAPNLKQYIHKYAKFPNLNLISINKGSDFWKSPFYVTHKPTRSVLEAFFNKQGSVTIDSYIVLDLTFADTLIKGKRVLEYYAVGSTTDLTIFNTPKECTFIPRTNVTGCLFIPTIPNYSWEMKAGSNKAVATSDVTKRTKYANVCLSLYQKLATAIG